MKIFIALTFALLSSAPSDFNESECRANPAIATDQHYLRTHSALYAFGKKV